MPDESQPADNITRLLSRLKEDSLAARLVEAYCDSDDLARLIDQRISEVKRELDPPQD